MARLKEKWHKGHPLEELEVVRMESTSKRVWTILAALMAARWWFRCRLSGIDGKLVGGLARLEAAGDECSCLVIADGHLGIWGALCNVYPEAEEQRCWNHRIVNILKVPKREQPPALLILRQIPYAESRQEAERLKRVFQEWCRSRGLAPAPICWTRTGIGW